MIQNPEISGKPGHIAWSRLSQSHRSVHFLKKLAASASAYLPWRARFRLLGLPGRLKKREVIEEEGSCVCRFLERPIIASLGAHLTQEGELIEELSPGSNSPITERFLLQQRLFPSIEGLAFPVISLALDSQENFFHWFYQVVPRIRFLSPAISRPGTKLLLCQKYRFHQEAFELLGWKSSELIPLERSRFFSAPQATIPPFISSDEPWIVPWLREHFLPPALQRVRASSFAFPKRFLVSRQKATSRQIINEAQLLASLKPWGFEKIVVEDLSLAEQMVLFHQAEAVVAPHGAGLTHLTFSQSPCLVLELITQNLEGPFYQRIAQQLQLHYHEIRCYPQEGQSLFQSHFEVPIASVVERIKARFQEG